MTADEALQQLRDMVAQVGQAVAIGRYTGTGPTRVRADTPTRGYVRNYSSTELIGAILQGDSKAVVLIDNLSAILPVTTNNFLVVGTKEFAIKNPLKRVVSGVQIGLDIQARG